MKRRTRGLALVLAALAVVPGVLAGQEDDGPGGFLEWIHRLSGPSMLGPGAFWTRGWEDLTVRVSGAVLFPVAFRDQIDEDHSLNMISLGPALEVPVAGPFAIGGGIDLHRFGGEGHDAVYHLSMPLYGQLRFPLDDLERWRLRVDVGARYFPRFDGDDFDGGVSVETGQSELTFVLRVGVDYPREEPESRRR